LSQLAAGPGVLQKGAPGWGHRDPFGGAPRGLPPLLAFFTSLERFLLRVADNRAVKDKGACAGEISRGPAMAEGTRYTTLSYDPTDRLQ
jgi:hypothetical protein